ncbi:unnamed protein product [Pocillopora meandrina]|uniref:Methyltransferase type 11 domain-containing protein n=1 Tax=Pocillopora meandrina TaxID=46732 RepID=A0AAU9Y090_9CNID|nr:unnamed protein product [Pocillopora meandrina]
MDENLLKAVLTKYFGEKTGNVTRETSKDELKCIYDERSGTYDQEILAVGAAFHKPLAKCLHNALKEVLKDKPKDQIKIMDAGAGTGLIGVELKKLDYTNLCALDISPGMLNEAKKKNVYNELICAPLSGQQIPQIKSGQFDALISGGALHEGRVSSSAFVEMIRMVRADGLLCFNIWEGQLGDYQEMMRQLEKDGKWICLSRETLPLFTAVDMPKECLGFVYKVLKN